MPEVLCKRRLVSEDGVLVSQTEEFHLAPIPISRWDTPDAVRLRVLHRTDDLPVSVRWVDDTVFYSLRYTIRANPYLRLADLYRRVSTFAFPSPSCVYTALDCLYCFIEAHPVDAQLLHEIEEWSASIGGEGGEIADEIRRDPIRWYHSRERAYRDEFGRAFARIEGLLRLDEVDLSEWPSFHEASSASQKTIAYDYDITLMYGTSVSCQTLLEEISVASWDPSGWGLVAAYDTDGKAPIVQTSRGRLPFPLPSLPSDFFPGAQDEPPPSTPLLQCYFSTLGWAELSILRSGDGRSVVRLGILENHTVPQRPFEDVLDTWETLLGPVAHRQGRVVQDLGVLSETVFSGIPPTKFSWPNLFYSIVNDPVLSCFFSFRQPSLGANLTLPHRQAPTTPIIDQHLDLLWTAYAHKLWGIRSSSPPSGCRLAIFYRDAPEVSYEIRFETIGSVPDSSLRPILKCLSKIFVYSGRSEVERTGFSYTDATRLLYQEAQTLFHEYLKQHFRLTPETDLTKLLPRIFITPFYKSLCQLPLQPVLASEEQLEAIGEDEDRRLLFPPQPMHDIVPTWYVCPSTKYPYPGLKKNNIEHAVFPLVPCCFEKPQSSNNREKLLKMTMGVDIVSSKRRLNIIQKHHIIRQQGQLGVNLPALEPFFLAHYPEQVVYRVGMDWTPFSLLECLHYVSVNGASMPISQWYPAHLINLLLRHGNSFVGFFPFHSVDDMIRKIQHPDPSFWVDPRVFLPWFEQIFQTQIFVWAEASPNDHRFTLLASPPGQPRFDRCVYIVQHYGGRMDRLSGKAFPQCELLEHDSIIEKTDIEVLTAYFPPPRTSLAARSHRTTPFASRQDGPFTAQALFATGAIMAVRAGPLTLWFEEPVCRATDLPFWDPFTKEAVATIESTTSLARFFRSVPMHPERTVYRGRILSRTFCLWEIRLDGYRLYMLTTDIPLHGIREIVPDADVRPLTDPPFVLAPLLSILSRTPTTTPLRPGLERDVSPRSMVRNYSVLNMIRDVALYRFLRWQKDTPDRVLLPLDEQITAFLRAFSRVDVGHYTSDRFPERLPARYGPSEALCCDAALERIILPSASVRSRLFFELQWTLLYDPARACPSPTDERPSRPPFARPLRSRDRHNVYFPWEGFQDILASTTPLPTPLDTPRLRAVWAALPHPAASYTIRPLPVGMTVKAFVSDHCPPWREIPEARLFRPSAQPVPIRAEEPVSSVGGIAHYQWDERSSQWILYQPPDSPRPRHPILVWIAPDETGPRIILHPSFFEFSGMRPPPTDQPAEN